MLLAVVSVRKRPGVQVQIFWMLCGIVPKGYKEGTVLSLHLPVSVTVFGSGEYITFVRYPEKVQEELRCEVVSAI